MLGAMLPILGIFAGGAFVLLLAPLIFRETGRARAIDRRLETVRGQAIAAARAPEGSDRPGGGVLFRTVGLAALRIGSMLVPVGAAEREKIARMLRGGGFAEPEALSIFLSAKLAGGLALGIGAGIWATTSDMVGQHGFVVVIAALAGLAVGGIIPEYVLRALVARRLRSMTAVLPDALDMMVMCLESGLTMERGFLTIADALVPIERNLAREFRQIEAELRVGADRRTVLEEYYRRCEIDGLRDLAMALIQGDRYGTPVSQSMRGIASDERLQKAARIATQAERLPVLMTLPMLLFVVPGTMLLVAGPAFLQAMSAMSGLGK